MKFYLLLFNYYTPAIFYLLKNPPIVHLDINPSNILIDSNLNIKLIGFTFSIQLSSNVENVSLNIFPDHSFYNPPEIYLENAEWSYSFDIWSIGIVLYQLATGHFPFPSDDFELYKANIINPNVSIPIIDCNINSQFKELIVGMLNRNPFSRIHPDLYLQSKLFNHFSKNFEHDIFKMPSPLLLPSNSILLKYFQYKKNIASGSFGFCVQYLCKEKEESLNIFNGIDYVIKNSNPVSNIQDQNKFVEEAKLLEKLEHPYIVSYKFHFVELNQLNLVMEFCPSSLLNRILDHFVQNRVFDMHTILSYGYQLLSALQYLHSLPTKIIHRDIKPANILIDCKRNIKLCDFGLSLPIEGSYVKGRSFGGTIAYAPPESFESSSEIRPSFDIWSVGIVLYQLATLNLPFKGDNTDDLKHNIINEEIHLISGVSLDFNNLIHQMLLKDPLSRPSADVLLQNEIFNGIKKELL